MAATVFDTSDLIHFDTRPLSRRYPSTTWTNVPATGTEQYHAKAGIIEARNTSLPYMHVADLRWQTAGDIELRETAPTGTIDINFVLEGSIDSRFRGLGNDLNMRTQTHNLIHMPEAGHTNWIKGNQSMALLLISLDKDFFASSIGQDDAWSERILTNLLYERPFSGVKNTQTITSRMRYLINDIRDCRTTGPMRNLLIQSRVLELVALEIDQFRSPVTATELIPQDEVAKLHQLKAYLEANFLAEHSLAQLSRYCALNEFKVKKGFKQLFDTTVFNYLRKLRMDYAGHLLRNCALSVDEVADTLGYDYSQHFSVAFKKYTGLTPSQYQHSTKRVPVASNPN